MGNELFQKRPTIFTNLRILLPPAGVSDVGKKLEFLRKEQRVLQKDDGWLQFDHDTIFFSVCCYDDTLPNEFEKRGLFSWSL